MRNKLREVRVVKRITQFLLRVATEIHQSKISMIENGLIQPCEDEAKRLARAGPGWNARGILSRDGRWIAWSSRKGISGLTD